jgi:hypothetical protein
VSSVVVDFITPETDTSIWYFWGMARNFNPKDKALTASIREGQGKIFSEDLEMLESQQRNLLARPERKLLNLNIDAGGVQSRRVLERIIAEERGQSPSPPPRAHDLDEDRSVTRQLIKVRVETKRVEATDICSFELADPSGNAMPPFTAARTSTFTLPKAWCANIHCAAVPASWIAIVSRSRKSRSRAADRAPCTSACSRETCLQSACREATSS